MGSAPFLYLSAADVAAAMPSVEENITLARRTMLALVDSAELPPKFGVNPRQSASLAHAMPALLRGTAPDGADDLMGIKWVTAFGGNREQGIDAIHATVILNSPTTGEPIAILDGAPITAQRTAAVSGVALREWWPQADGPTSIAVIGAGVQGAAHLEVLARIAPRGSALTIADRHPARAQELCASAVTTGAFGDTRATGDVESAIAGADVVLTMVSFGPERQAVAPRAFERARLIVAVDYDMCVPASVAAASSVFLTDDIAQFEATRSDHVFAHYPTPDASIGHALTGTTLSMRGSGPIVFDHLGVGLADVVFADAIYRRAVELHLGTELPR